MNVKKIALIAGGVILALILFVVVAVVFFGGDSSTASAGSLEDGTLTVAVVPVGDMYLSGTAETGYSGVEMKLAETMASTAGVNLELVEYASKTEAVAALSAGNVDMVLARIGATSSYTSGMLTSITYGKAGLYLVLPENQYFTTLTALSGEQLGVTGDVGITMRLDVPQISDVSVLELPNLDLNMLSSNVIAGIICTEGEAYSLIGEDVEIMPIQNSPTEELVALMAPGDTYLQQVANVVVNAYLDGLLDPAPVETAETTEETQETN